MQSNLESCDKAISIYNSDVTELDEQTNKEK